MYLINNLRAELRSSRSKIKTTYFFSFFFFVQYSNYTENEDLEQLNDILGKLNFNLHLHVSLLFKFLLILLLTKIEKIYDLKNYIS